jgi:hypothetical protein
MKRRGGPETAVGRAGLLLAASLVVLAGCQEARDPWPRPPVLNPGEFLAPPPAARPWVRFWWPGGDVADGELGTEIAALAVAGFGGFELQAFDAALDPALPADARARRLSYDTPDFRAHLSAALAGAAEAGLGVDLTLGSGWPASGVHLQPAESLRALWWSEWSFEGPGEAELPALVPAAHGFYEVAELAEELVGERLTRFLPDEARLVAVLAARVRSGARSASVLDLKDTLELSASSVQVLTGQVTADGSLRWSVPEGRWQVVAFFDGPDGQLPQLVAQDGDGYLLDHFHAGEVEELLERYIGDGAGLGAFHGAPVRAVFSDSFELKSDRHFAADFMGEFQARRGYDLTPWLPAVLWPGADNYIYEVGRVDRAAEFVLGPDDERIRHDYARTVSDLFLDRFLRTGETWASARGMCTRVQNHGMEIDVLQAAGAVSIPESEQLYAGGSDLFLKVAASGAQLYGRALASAEALVSPGRDYMLTPAKVRALADKAFGAGINQLVLHGLAYDAAGDYGPPGWTPFSSPYGGTNTYAAHLGPGGGLWDFLPVLNTYLARCQWMLRQGRPSADLLVYYPWLGFPSSLALEPTYREPLLGGYLEGMEPELREVPFAALAALFGPQITAPRTAWLLALAPVLSALESAGVTWAWVNDERIEALRLRAGRLEVGGASYGALLVFQAPWMEPPAAERLAALGRAGAAVLLLGSAPGAQPGFQEHEAGDARVARSFERLADGARFMQVSGAEELLTSLRAFEAGPAAGVKNGDGVASEWRLLERRLSDLGYLFFVRNQSAGWSEGRLQIRGGCPDARFWDAWTGEISRATLDAEGLVPLRLGALESVFLVCGDGVDPPGTLDLPAWARRLGDGARSERLAGWHLRVEGADVEGGLFDADLDELQDWRALPGLQSCSSPGNYTATFELPEGFERAEIDLGWVQGVARVRVNDQAAGELFVPPFRVEVSGLARPGTNTLEVEVQVPLRNRFVGAAEAGDPLAAQFQGKGATRVASGLLGPAYVWVE